MKRETARSPLLLLCLLLAGALAFCGLYRWDNKYTAALPGGPGYNVLQGNGEDIAFLVDGWEYYPGRLLSPEELSLQQGALHTYIGEYPNFSAHLASPYGRATYRLILKVQDPETPLSLYIPELLCAGRVYLNGRLAGSQGSVEPYRPHVTDALYLLPTAGETEIVIQCANYTHYYSGLYYPPAVGSAAALSQMIAARLMVYGLFCFGSMALALSYLALCLFERDRQRFWLGLLCLAFALRMSYPFLRAMGVPLIRSLYALEDFCGNAVLLLAILLAGELSGAGGFRYHRLAAVPAAVGLCAVTVVFPLLILPYAPIFINTYGMILFVWKGLAGAYLLFLAFRGLSAAGPLGGYLLSASGLYGLSVAAAVWTVNRFEPIRGAWPEEYGGFALVLGFAALMVHREVLLSAENRRLNLHLQEEVDRKTQTLEALLTERKELLAGLLHDLKNPLAAMRNYAELVRLGGVALDRETAAYLSALSERAETVEERLELLQSFSRRERGMAGFRPILLNDFLRQFYENNLPDMELFGQAFRLELTAAPLSVLGDEAQLRSALENLCYNALSFTPEEGTVTLSLREEEGMAAIAVADTGRGIAEEDLPHIFERGFTRRPEGGGEGMGLYLVRTAAMEHGGSVEAVSRPGQGSLFTLRLPLLPPSR